MAQPDNLEVGIYFHQIRATPTNKTVLVVARGNNAAGGKPEDPGSLHVFGFKNGVLSNLHKIQPNWRLRFLARGISTCHPTMPLVYVSIERQNQLIVYRMTPDGDLVTEPVFTKGTLADPDKRIRVQSAGPIHIHPTRPVRLSRQSLRRERQRRAWGRRRRRQESVLLGGDERHRGVRRQSANRRMPTAIQHADIHAAHPAESSRSTARRRYWCARWHPPRCATTARSSTRPAGLSVFRVGADGKLDFVRKYDIDVGTMTQWWSGMVPLA